MEQKLFTEIRSLYMSSKEHPHSIRIRIRMRDLIDPEVLRSAVDTTMRRYPYFCVELERRDGDFYYVENHRPIVVTNSLAGTELNSEDSNYHMIAFHWKDNWIIMDLYHGMTDGVGAYEVLRTLLYYYCSERYHVTLDDEKIRLVGDEILEEEWLNPVVGRDDLPTPAQAPMSEAFDLIGAAGLEDDHKKHGL